MDENQTICSERLGSPTSNFSSCAGGAQELGGAVNPQEDDFTLFVVGTCWQDTMVVDEKAYNKVDVASVFAYLDAAFIAVFMYLVFWLQDRELASVEMQDAAQVTAADFTVRILKLPHAYNKATSDALREELKLHFEKTLTLS